MSIFLGVIGVAVAFLLLWINLRIADRLSPRWAPFDLSEEEELIERFREWIEPRARQVRFWVTGILALLLGLAVASWREDVFLFLNSQDFGVSDPIFSVDIGFYVFQLPLWADIADWVFNALVLTLIVVVASHYFNGGIRFNGRRFTVARGPKIHISVLLALIALVRAAVYRLDMYELLFSNREQLLRARVHRYHGPASRLPAADPGGSGRCRPVHHQHLPSGLDPGRGGGRVLGGGRSRRGCGLPADRAADPGRHRPSGQGGGVPAPQPGVHQGGLGFRSGGREAVCGSGRLDRRRHRGQSAHDGQLEDLGSFGAALHLSELPGAAHLLQPGGGRHRSLPRRWDSPPGDARRSGARGARACPG